MPDLTPPATNTLLVQKWNRFIDNVASYQATTLAAPAIPQEPAAANALPVVAGFKVLKELGRGGMGRVYLVQDSLKRFRALKIIRRDRQNATSQTRFGNEAHAMAALNHPNVATVYDYHEATGNKDLSYIVMPVYASTLLDRFAYYQGDQRHAVQLLAEIAEGLGYLHAHGFVHRDVKPTNILLDAAGRAIVSDFGLVKHHDDHDSHEFPAVAAETATPSHETGPHHSPRANTSAGTVLGTKKYMSPEQAAGKHEQANPTWDVWSFGILAQELLGKNVPPALQRIINRCLASQPSERYPNGSDVANDLRAWLQRPTILRKRLLAGLAAVSVTAAAFGFTFSNGKGRSPTSPTEVRYTAEQEATLTQQRLVAALHQGPVTLLGNKGTPDYHVPTSGKAYLTEKAAISDGAYTLESQRTSLVELVPADVAEYGFRLKAKVRLNTHANSNSRAGIFCAYRKWVGAEAPVHTYLELGFDWQFATPTIADRTSDSACFSLMRIGHNADPGLKREVGLPLTFAGGIKEPLPDQLDERFAKYHDLVLEFTPDAYRASANGKALYPVDRALYREFFNDLKDSMKLNLDLDQQIRGGMGLFVRNASASFKDVQLELIPMPNRSQ